MRQAERRWVCASAGGGAVLWLAAPWLPIGSPPAFGSIEHVFLSLPLVSSPLALALLFALLQPGHRERPLAYVAAQRLQPLAALFLLASFSVPRGPWAAALTSLWSLMAVLLVAGRARAANIPESPNLSTLSALAAHAFLLAGAVWLSLSRLGVAVGSFSTLTVFLAATHFHFAGFALQILIAATGRRLPSSAPIRCASHRGLAVFAMLAIPLIAAGNAAQVPALKLTGVLAMIASTLALAVISIGIAHGSRAPIAKALLIVSAASVGVGMIIAGVYGASEAAGRAVIAVPRMALVHGLVNALGFVACGSSAHLLLATRSAEDLEAEPSALRSPRAR